MAAAQAAEKLLKTMVMNEDWLDIYDEDICIKSSLKPFTKLIASKKKSKFKDIFPWNISQMITKTILIITRIVIRWKEESTFGLKESQLKLIHDQNF